MKTNGKRIVREATKNKPKSATRIAVPVTIDPEQVPRLDALVAMDGSNRCIVMRKALDYAYLNPHEALKPMVGKGAL